VWRLKRFRSATACRQIAARHELHPNQVSAWKRQQLDAVSEVFAKGGSRKLAQEHEAKIHERFGMIEPDGPQSLSRQCMLLGVSRSSLHYRLKGGSAENLALMRRTDELHMDYPFYKEPADDAVSPPRGSRLAGTGSDGSCGSWGWRQPTGDGSCCPLCLKRRLTISGSQR